MGIIEKKKKEAWVNCEPFFVKVLSIYSFIYLFKWDTWLLWQAKINS